MPRTTFHQNLLHYVPLSFRSTHNASKLAHVVDLFVRKNVGTEIEETAAHHPFPTQRQLS